jgi:hypothetical protein
MGPNLRSGTSASEIAIVADSRTEIENEREIFAIATIRPTVRVDVRGTLRRMKKSAHLTILTSIALSTAVACGGGQKEAETPADESADEEAVDDDMMDLAESDMPDDGFEDEGMDEGMEGEEMPEDEMAE